MSAPPMTSPVSPCRRSLWASPQEEAFAARASISNPSNLLGVRRPPTRRYGQHHPAP
jgi:hypothetical protein